MATDISNILYLISQRYSTFSRSNKLVADYIMKNIHNIAFTTLDALAKEIGVSTTTIIRFAHTLGFTGYSDMQKEIQDMLIDKISLPARLDSFSRRRVSKDQLLSDTFNSEIRDIQSTLSALPEGSAAKALDAIVGGKTLYILGMRGSFSLAVYAYARIGQVRRDTRLIHTTGMLFPEELMDAKEGDVCLAFFFQRYSRNASQIISWLKKKKVTVVIITGEHPTGLEEHGDVILPCNVSSQTVKNSYVAPMCLVNYLYNAIITEDYDSSKEVLDEIEQFLSDGYFLSL